MQKYPEKSSKTKVSEDISLVFFMSTVLSLKDMEIKHDVYQSNHFMKKFCKSIREHAMKVIN